MGERAAPGVEELLSKGQDLGRQGREGDVQDPQPSVVRNKTRVVSYRVPHNAAVQVYDYREKRARVVLGLSWCHWVPKSSSPCCPTRLGGPSVPMHAVHSACCSGRTSQMSSPSKRQTMPGCSCSLPTTGIRAE